MMNRLVNMEVNVMMESHSGCKTSDKDDGNNNDNRNDNSDTDDDDN